MDFGIKGKRALVLGASKGLGAASAKALAEEGAQVFAGARGAIDWAEGLPVTPLVVDLSGDAWRPVVEGVLADGPIDILVLNTGGPKAGPAAGQGLAGWAAAFEAMALPFFAVAEMVLPGMRKAGWGRIVTIGSSGIVQPIPGLALSNGIRGAVAGWSKTLAAEVAKDGVTVNLVLPGRVATDRVASLDAGAAERTGKSVDAVRDASIATIPAGRYGRPEEFGAAVAFLASAQASYITGSMIRVDGGMIRGM